MGPEYFCTWLLGSLYQVLLELCLQQTILRDEVMSPGGTKNRLAKQEAEAPNHALYLDRTFHVHCGTYGTGAINIKKKLMLLPIVSITVQCC